MAVIYPAPGEEKATVQQLLNMANSPRDVQVTTDTLPGTGYVAFLVPDELSDRWVDAKSEAVAEVEKLVAEALDKEEKAAAKKAAPAKRGPGRPRKAQQVVEEAPEESEDDTEDETDEEDPEE